MTNYSKTANNNKQMAMAYHQAGYAVACYDMKIPVPAVSIKSTEPSDVRKTFAASLTFAELDTTLEKSRLVMEKNIIAVLSGLESEKRYYKTDKLNLEKSVEKKIRQYIALFTHTDRELTAYYHLLNIRAQDYIKDPLVWQKIKDLAGEIFKSKELSANQVRVLIRQSFTRSFEKWKKRQHNKDN